MMSFLIRKFVIKFKVMHIKNNSKQPTENTKKSGKDGKNSKVDKITLSQDEPRKAW